ncbi:MAG: aldo/keto reductase [Armatimonadota bacterium]
MNRLDRMSRRDFVSRGALLAGTGLVGWQHLAHAAEPETEIRNEVAGMKYRRLGRTGLMVSEVSLGAMLISEDNSAVVEAALDRGVNYIDTDPSYMNTRSESALGGLLKHQRDRVFLATKVGGKWLMMVFKEARKTGKLPPLTPEFMRESTEQSLKRLQTDYLDVLFLHGPAAPELANKPDVVEQLLRFKQEGKARFIGASCHLNIRRTLETAVRSGAYDVIMPAYNAANAEQLQPLLESAKQADVGVLAMKTVAKLAGELGRTAPELGRDSGLSRAQACIRWALDDDRISSAMVGMKSLQEVNEAVALCGKALSDKDRQLLERQAANLDTFACSMCGRCGQCPRGVAVADVLRCQMYHDEYGSSDLGKGSYALLPPSAQAGNCRECGDCEAACPRQLPLRAMLSRAHRSLS